MAICTKCGKVKRETENGVECGCGVKLAAERSETGALLPDEILSSADKRIPGNIKDIGEHIPTRPWTKADDVRAAFRFAPGKSTAKALGALAAAGGLGYGAVKGIQKSIENKKQEEIDREKSFPVEVGHEAFMEARNKFYSNPAAMLSAQKAMGKGMLSGGAKGLVGGAGAGALLSLLATKGVPAVSRFTPKHSLGRWLSAAVPTGAGVGGYGGMLAGALGGAAENERDRGFSPGGAFKTHRMSEERARKAKVEDLRKQGSPLLALDQLVAGSVGSAPSQMISGSVAKAVAPEGQKAVSEDRAHRIQSLPSLIGGVAGARAADKSGLTRKVLQTYLNKFPMGAVAKGRGVLLERALVPFAARIGGGLAGAGAVGAGIGALSGLKGHMDQAGEKLAGEEKIDKFIAGLLSRRPDLAHKFKEARLLTEDEVRARARRYADEFRRVAKKDRCWEGYEPVPGKKPYSEDSCRPVGSKKDKKKEAGDMPPFLEQDRPESVKKIYKALKRDHPEMSAEMKARIAARQGKKGKQKQGPPYKGPIEKKASALLGVALDRLWGCYGGPVDGEKTAAGYFYSIQKPELDRECFGEEFCKVANARGMDPWALADTVASQLDAFLVLEKTAEDLRMRELAGFYRRWAAGTMEKAAGIKAVKAFGSKLKNMSSAGKMDTAIKGLKSEGSKAVDTGATAIGPSAVPKKQSKKGYTLGEKALGGVAIGAPVAGGMALMGDSNAQ